MFQHINKVIKVIVITDFFYNFAFGSFAPVFAIFITKQIHGGTASVVGYATAIYWIVKSIFQLPIARFLDRTDGETDDFWALFFGYLLTSLVPFSYIFATEPWHLYAIHAFYGFVMAWLVPAWYSIFTRHVDKWRISFEWSLESVISVGIAMAASAALGGYIVDRFGFQSLFIGSGIVSFLFSFLLLGIRGQLLKKDHLERVFPEARHHRR